MSPFEIATLVGLRRPLCPAPDVYQFPPCHTVVRRRGKWAVSQGSEWLGDHESLSEAFEKVAAYVLRISSNLL